MSRPTTRGISSGVKTEIQTPSPWIEPLAAYLAWMRSARRSEGTIYLHSYHLRRYAHRTRRAPWPVTVEELADYLGTHSDLGASSLRTMRQVLRGFYAWAHVVGRVDANPAAHLLSIRATVGIPRPAPEHAVKVGTHHKSERSRLMVRLGVNAGLRCCEIAAVHTRDVFEDLVGWSLIVHGKGDKKRTVPLPDDLAGALRTAEPGYLFPGKINGHLSPSRVSELISEALPPGITAHQLRHRYATRAYQHGGRDIRAVQDLLGHAYVSTTQIYTAVDDAAKRRAALAAAS